MSSGKLKKAQYYVWYLGWKECRGLAGREFTEAIVRELLQSRSQEELPKLTIELSKKELKVTQLVEKKKGKIDKVKYPSIPCRDITYATQALPPYDDVVACIYLGYNPSTKSAVHEHVYRCDSPDTAAIFVTQLDLVVQMPENQMRIRKIEEELSSKGHIVKRPSTRLEGYLHGVENRQKQQNGEHFTQNGDFQKRKSNHQADEYGGIHITIGSGSHSSGSDPQSPHSPPLQQTDLHSPPLQQPNIRRSYTNEANPKTHNPASSSRHSSSEERVSKQVQQQNPEIDEQQQQEFESLAAELKSKLGREPLLLPPKDYDTIHRKRGNAFDIGNRKCLNQGIIGQYGYDPDQNVHVHSGSSNNNNTDKGSSDKNLPQQQQQQQQPPQEVQKQNGGLPKRGSQNSFDNKGSFDDEDDEMAQFSRMQSNGLPRTYDNSIPEDILNQQVPTPRAFSPGPLTKELQSNSYFPQKGPDLPNYLNKRRGSLNRYSSGEQSEDGDTRSGTYQPPQSSNRYSASSLGLTSQMTSQQHKILRKQQSASELEYNPHSRFRRQKSYDGSGGSSDRQEDYPPGYFYNNGKYTSPPRSGRSSGSNTMRSDSHESNNNNGIDLSASLPAMKFKSRNSKDMSGVNPSRVYMDEDDPGAYIPIDYTVAARVNKPRKALP